MRSGFPNRSYVAWTRLSWSPAAAFYAGLVAKYVIEHWTRIPCEVELASEFRYA